MRKRGKGELLCRLERGGDLRCCGGRCIGYGHHDPLAHLRILDGKPFEQAGEGWPEVAELDIREEHAVEQDRVQGHGHLAHCVAPEPQGTTTEGWTPLLKPKL